MRPVLVVALAVAAAGLAADRGPIEGLAASPVKVVVYENLQCSDCAVFRKMMDERLLPQYGGRVAFIHRDFPLPRHTWARPAAIAGRFFHERSPELGVRYRRETMAALRETNAENFETRLAAFAKANGVPEPEALAALKDQRLAALVEKDYQEGVARGVSRTPTVYVNGVPFIERFTLEDISKGIEQALAEAN
jgi:protein-disulfide isomerase